MNIVNDFIFLLKIQINREMAVEAMIIL